MPQGRPRVPRDAVRVPQDVVRVPQDVVRVPQDVIRVPRDAVRVPQETIEALRQTQQATREALQAAELSAPHPRRFWVIALDGDTDQPSQSSLHDARKVQRAICSFIAGALDMIDSAFPIFFTIAVAR